MLAQKIREARESFDYRESNNQDNTFSYRHVRFYCEFEIGGEILTFEYQPAPIVGVPEFDDLLMCLMADVSCVYYDVTFDEFCNDLGYFPIYSVAEFRRAEDAYDGCKHSLSELRRVFEDEELMELMGMDEDELRELCNGEE